jgi:hypothetical protein
MRLPLKRSPIGRMERINISFVRCTSFVPSRRCVIRSSTRVPIAAKPRWKVTTDEKNGELEVEGVVQIIVVDDDGDVGEG